MTSRCLFWLVLLLFLQAKNLESKHNTAHIVEMRYGRLKTIPLLLLYKNVYDSFIWKSAESFQLIFFSASRNLHFGILSLQPNTLGKSTFCCLVNKYLPKSRENSRFVNDGRMQKLKVCPFRHIFVQLGFCQF